MTGRAIVLLSLAALASAAGLRVTDPLLALISSEYRVTPGAAAAVITGFSVAYGLLQVVHGPIGDRFGKYHVVTAATALSALGTFACAAAPSLGWLIAARFASGATVGALIFNARGEVLMIRTHKWSGLWGIPGGKIKWGETSEAALRREIKEETNLKVTDIKFVLVQDCIHSTVASLAPLQPRHPPQQQSPSWLMDRHKIRPGQDPDQLAGARPTPARIAGVTQAPTSGRPAATSTIPARRPPARPSTAPTGSWTAATDADAGNRIDEILSDLSLELAADLPHFPLPENIQDVLPEHHILAIALNQPLLDQPLLPADQCVAHVPAETVVGTLLVHLAGKLAVEPGRARRDEFGCSSTLNKSETLEGPIRHSTEAVVDFCKLHVLWPQGSSSPELRGERGRTIS